MEDLELLHELVDECVKVHNVKLIETSVTNATQEVILLGNEKAEMVNDCLVPEVESVAEVVLESGDNQFLPDVEIHLDGNKDGFFNDKDFSDGNKLSLVDDNSVIKAEILA